MTTTETLPANQLILDLTTSQYSRLAAAFTLPSLIRSRCQFISPSDRLIIESVHAEPIGHRYQVTITFRVHSRDGNQVFSSPIDFTSNPPAVEPLS
jgi:hypothetical protein